MYLDLRVPGISKELAIGGIYEPETTLLLREELKEGSVVADIGANIGYHTLIEAAIVGSKGRIYAFEPDPRNFRLLKKNIGINGKDAIVDARCMALSDAAGNSNIYLGESSDINTMLPADKMEHLKGHRWESAEVECVPLDDFLKDRRQPDFIRMDVNGYEAKVFKGAMGTIKNTRAGFKILFELHMHAYYRKDYSLEPILVKFFEMGLKPKILVSTDESGAGVYRQLGYKPDRVVENRPFKRGIYYDIKTQDAVPLACRPPKSTKFMLLEKPAGGRYEDIDFRR